MTKDEIREYMKIRRRNLTQEFIDSASLSIEGAAISKIQDKNTVMVYISAFKEPDTYGIIDKLRNLGIRIAVPVSDTDTCTITPSVLTSVHDMQKGAYGIYEPRIVIPISPEEIDAVLIPGVAFGISGERLGFGKGYYDRFLAEFHGLKIGICYDFQVMDNLPVDKHDVKMDLIITEKGIYNDF